MVSIEGLRKGEVLASLYNNAKVQGMGFLQAKEGDMSEQEADIVINKAVTELNHYVERLGMSKENLQEAIKNIYFFDYLFGRVMKVNIYGNEFSEASYDRDNGEGSAQRVITKLRKDRDVEPNKGIAETNFFSKK